MALLVAVAAQDEADEGGVDLTELVGTTTTTTYPPQMERTGGQRCVLNNFQSYCTCLTQCAMGNPYMKAQPWLMNCSAQLTDMDKMYGRGYEEQFVFNVTHRIALANRACAYDFLHCEMKCSDCVACRTNYEIDKCKYAKAREDSQIRICSEGKVKRAEIESLEKRLHCGLVCPDKILYPRCTACCHCLDYDATMKRIIDLRNAPPTEEPRDIMGMTVDYEQVYDMPKVAEDKPHVLDLPMAMYCSGTAVFVFATIFFMYKKNWFSDYRKKTYRIRAVSTATGEAYIATDLPEHAEETFRHPVFKPSGKNEHLTRRPPRDRNVGSEVSVKEAPKPLLNWEQMLAEDEAADRAALAAMDDSDRPICWDFVRGDGEPGSCKNARCLLRHTLDVGDAPWKFCPPVYEDTMKDRAMDRFGFDDETQQIHYFAPVKGAAPPGWVPPPKEHGSDSESLDDLEEGLTDGVTEQSVSVDGSRPGTADHPAAGTPGDKAAGGARPGTPGDNRPPSQASSTGSGRRGAMAKRRASRSAGDPLGRKTMLGSKEGTEQLRANANKELASEMG